MTTFRGFDPATMHARPMAAYRASTCLCGQPIAVGDGIALVKRRWRCMTPPTASLPSRLQPTIWRANTSSSAR